MVSRAVFTLLAMAMVTTAIPSETEFTDSGNLKSFLGKNDGAPESDPLDPDAKAFLELTFTDIRNKNECQKSDNDIFGAVSIPDDCIMQVVEGELWICQVQTAKHGQIEVRFMQHTDADEHPTNDSSGLTDTDKLRERYEMKYMQPNIYRQACASNLATVTHKLMTIEGDTHIVQHATGHIQGPPREEKPLRLTQEQIKSIPESYDARDLTPGASCHEGLNQGGCGSCYAFGSMSAMSYRVWLQSQGKHNVVLSPTTAADCANGCNGGNMGLVVSGTSGLSGIPSRRCDPYDAGDIAEAQCSVGTAEQCDDGTTALPYKLTNSQGFSRRYYTNGWPTDRTFEEVEQGFMKEVSDNGPVYVVVAAGGEYGSIAGWDIYNGDPGGTLNHANVLLGWGVEAGVKYWIIQNSWGTQWGEGGFARVRRGVNTLGIESGRIEWADIEIPTTCDSAAECQNSGTWTSSCGCGCIKGFSGATCGECTPSCNGGTHSGEGGIVGTTCGCMCKPGYFSISEHDELKDCGQTMKLNNQDVDDVQIGSGEAAWIASTKEAWYLKSGDRYVVVPVGAVPWTADAGWNTAAKFTWVCYPQTEPYYCSSITQPRFNGDKSSTFKNLADGHYDIWFSKYLGTNEFGEDKGWSIEFKLNQQLTIGDSTAPAPAEDADDADDEAAAQAADGEAAAAQAADDEAAAAQAADDEAAAAQAAEDEAAAAQAAEEEAAAAQAAEDEAAAAQAAEDEAAAAQAAEDEAAAAQAADDEAAAAQAAKDEATAAQAAEEETAAAKAAEEAAAAKAAEEAAAAKAAANRRKNRSSRRPNNNRRRHNNRRRPNNSRRRPNNSRRRWNSWAVKELDQVVPETENNGKI